MQGSAAEKGLTGIPAYFTPITSTPTSTQLGQHSTPNTHITHPTTSPITTCTKKKKRRTKRSRNKYKTYKLPTQLQTTLHQRISFLDRDDEYGDRSKRKAKHCSRFCQANIGGFNIHHTDSQIAPADKTTRTFNGYVNLKSDIGGMVETNLDWRNQPPEGSFYQRKQTCSLKPIKAVLAHNTTAPPQLLASGQPKKLLHGGCVLMSLKPFINSRIVATDKDPEQLGRWSSFLVEGKSHQYIRYVTAYLPCPNATGNDTVYSQHQRHFRAQKTDREPVEAMIQDLHQAISSWIAEGEKVVIGMDANQDVRSGDMAIMLRTLGFEEQITSRHGPLEPPPNTHQMNTQGKPIDGIWTNFAHGELRCGYTAFGEGIDSDHRSCWIDIPDSIAYGYRPPDIHRVYPPGLTVADPRVRKLLP